MTPGQPAAAAAAVPAEPKPKAGDSVSFLAVKADAAANDAAQEGRLGVVHGGEVRASRRAAAAAAEPAAPAAPADLSGVADAYPGDDAPKEEMAAWMAKLAQDRGLPPELPVMASLVESGMKNLNFGDADSVGFFQMRVGIWNQGEYAGYPEKPELQMKWFLDQAEAVKDAAGRRRQADRRPELLRRVDRRRRAPRRAVPRQATRSSSTRPRGC